MREGQLQVLMPMGGLGSRFSQSGYKIPKPLIDIDGKPMFMRALQSFAGRDVVNRVFVIRQDQDRAYQLAQSIQKWDSQADVVILDHDTRGPVETCLEARQYINPEIPIAVADCDIYFESAKYFDEIEHIANQLTDGVLLTFPAHSSRYSYAEIDASTGLVLRTAEKKIISPSAILGGYLFRSGQLFLDLATEFISAGLQGLKEFYLSHLFNMLIANGGHVRAAVVDKMFIFGTPDELEKYRSLPRNQRL